MNFIHCHKQSTAFPVPVCMTLNRWTAAKCADCISSLTDRQKFSSVSKRDVHCAELYRNRSPPNFCGVAPVQNIIQIWRKIYKMRQNLIYGRRWSADSQNSNSWTVPTADDRLARSVAIRSEPWANHACHCIDVHVNHDCSIKDLSWHTSWESNDRSSPGLQNLRRACPKWPRVKMSLTFTAVPQYF